MTKQQMTEWQRESVKQAYSQLFAELMAVARAAGEVH